MGPLVEVDESSWPLLIVRIPTTLGAAAIESMFAGFDKALTRKAKFATLIDTTALAGWPGALERQRIGEYMKARTMAEAVFNVGIAVLIRSAPARAALTAINWIRQPVTPQFLAATFAEGVEWACGRLTRAGVPSTPALDALRSNPGARTG